MPACKIISAARLSAMSALWCNICGESLEVSAVSQHVAGKSHSIRRKVAEFNEMNAQFKPLRRDDVSIIRAWISDLHRYDFLSTGLT